MLPKRRRLSAQEVKEVLVKGHSRRAKNVSMKYLSHSLPLRAAVVISKAVAKKATERNRLRRSLYRVLAGTAQTGTAVFFVQKVPPNPLTESFSEEVGRLFPNT